MAISRSKRFSKTAKDSVFGQAIAQSIEDPSSLQNAIEFVEGPSGMRAIMRPVQRLIIKCLFGVPLDYKPEWANRIEGWGMIPMYDVYREKKLYSDVTEADYLRITYNEGRGNINDWRDIPNVGGDPGEAGFNEACIFAGRRGGKSELVAAIAAYKLYLLLNIRSPQEKFGLFPGSIIDFTFLAQDENGAHRLFKKLREHVLKAENFFAPYLKDTNAKDLSFVTLADREKQESTPTITVSCLPCVEENELVWSSDGLRPLKDINIGDILPDQFAVGQRVTWKHSSEKEVWALETANFRKDPLLLTPNHTCIFVTKDDAAKLPYLTVRKRNGLLTDTIDSRAKRRFADKDCGFCTTQGPLSSMGIGDYVLFPRIPENWRKAYSLDNGVSKTSPYSASCFGHRYTQHKSAARPVQAFSVTPGMCRLWGLYLAEGSINQRSVHFDFHINEKETLAKFVQETLLSEFGLSSRVIEKPESNGCRLMCNSVELSRGLERLFGNGCQNKTIPYAALSWPVECQRSLIRGYLDGDGSEGRDIAPTVSKQLAYSLFALGVQAGLLPSVLHRAAYTDKKGLSHRESWYVELCKQERHYRFYQKIDGREYYWSKVKSISNTGTVKTVIDISVEGTESFLTKLASVHNCTTNAVRSPSSIFLALDEFAHFRSAKGSTSDDMYAAASPSTADFHHDKKRDEPAPEQEMGTDFGEAPTVPFEEAEGMEPGIENEGENEGIQDSMILSISSPLKKIGKMYELHRLAMEEGVVSNIFTLNCPSAEMNPKLLPKFLKSEYKKNPLTFRAEYGGKFLESSESYVTEAAVKKCTACQWDEKGLVVEGSARINAAHFSPMLLGRNYFWGFDLGMTNDASALAIAHLEPGGPGGTIKLVFDYIDRMMVGERGEWPGIKSAPGQQKYDGYQVLPLEDILTWLDEMNKLLPCFKGATDQHGGQQLVQMLELKKIRNFELVNLTPAINSQMAYALRGYIESERCIFPYVPKFIQELKLVELEVTSKYRIRVAAPQEKGAHDDMADAAMLCAFLAQRWLLEMGQMMDPGGLSLLMQAQAGRPPAPLIGLDGIPMQVLKVMEKLKQAQQHTASYMGTSPVNPYSRRGRR